MEALSAAHGRDVDSRTERAADRKWSPVVFALDRLFPKRQRAPYATAERVVALVIIRAMSFDETEGAFNCFLSYPTIAKWAGPSLCFCKAMGLPRSFVGRSQDTRGATPTRAI